MPPVATQTEATGSAPETQHVINDAVVTIATKNGSGSQSANLILLRAIFGMGIPVSGKNLFPSNIAGLPTWFTIRVNEQGWLARRAESDVLIAMNDKTVEDDLAEMAPGTTVVLNQSLKHFVTRDDLDVIEVPFSALVKEACPDTRLRKRVINVIYVGVLAWLFDIAIKEVEEAIDRQFGAKAKAVEINRRAAEVGYAWAEETVSKHPLLRFERSDKTKDKIILEGNEAAALGLLMGGTTVLAWYPITPSSSVCEKLGEYLGKYRIDKETGKATFAVVQAEDEIGSMGVVLGAGWAGARAVTATSGPGLSLMAELAGLSYFAEIPAVVVDVQRMGPSTGLPTRTSQGDILSAYYLSHGDTKHVLLIPGDVEECYEFSRLSLDLAEQLQTLVLVMSDLDLGMNKWMSKEFTPPAEGTLPRGKVLDAEALERLGGFERYADTDGDGITYRTLPGTDHPTAAYFTRGTGHRPDSDYSENAENWQRNMDRLTRKLATARNVVPSPAVDHDPKATVGIIAYGSSDLAVEEARHILRDVRGVHTSYLRVRALPARDSIREFIEQYDSVYLVEQNRDAQMATILRTEFPEESAKVHSILKYNGLPLDAVSVVDAVLSQEAGE